MHQHVGPPNCLFFLLSFAYFRNWKKKKTQDNHPRICRFVFRNLYLLYDCSFHLPIAHMVSSSVTASTPTGAFTGILDFIIDSELCASWHCIWLDWMNICSPLEPQYYIVSSNVGKYVFSLSQFIKISPSISSTFAAWSRRASSWYTLTIPILPLLLTMMSFPLSLSFVAICYRRFQHILPLLTTLKWIMMIQVPMFKLSLKIHRIQVMLIQSWMLCPRRPHAFLRKLLTRKGIDFIECFLSGQASAKISTTFNTWQFMVS
jgi:hypothetical protein